MLGRHHPPWSSLVSIRQTDIFLSVALTRHFTFLQEIFLSLEISVHKSLSLFNFSGKKIQDGTSRIRSRSIDSVVHHFNPFSTEDWLTINGLICIYIATTLTLTLFMSLSCNIYYFFPTTANLLFLPSQ